MDRQKRGGKEDRASSFFQIFLQLSGRIDTEKMQIKPPVLSQFGIDQIVFIQIFIDPQERADCKIQFQNLCMHFLILAFFQETLHLSHQRNQFQVNICRAVKDLASLALPLQGQQLSVAFFQSFGKPKVFFFDQLFDLEKVLLADSGAVHLSSSVHKIMCLVDQKQIVSFISFPEKAFQMGIGIKDVVVIADDSVHPGGHVQTHFKGTDLPFSCLLLDHFSADGIGGVQKLIDRVVDPVKMPFRIGTGIGITLRFFTEADLFFGGQYDHFHPQSLLPQRLKRLPGHSAGNGFGGQIKDLLSQSFSHGPGGWKDGGNGFPHAGRGLDK